METVPQLVKLAVMCGPVLQGDSWFAFINNYSANKKFLEMPLLFNIPFDR